MRWSQMFIPTLRDDPADAEAISHRLMLRAGLIRQLGAGIYSKLPLAERVARKVEGIVREEMARIGAQEFRLPMLHPAEPARRSYVQECLAGRSGPVIAATDYIRSFADQIRPFVPRRYRVLGTDGYGRSDYRRNLRRFFEVDRHYVAVAALASLAEDGTVPAATVGDAISRYGIDPGKPDPART